MKKEHKFGYNWDGNESTWVTIQFHNLTEEQRKHLFEAEKHLSKAGITFDTGYAIQEKIRDWEFDWSLKGATVKAQRDYISKDKNIKKEEEK